MRTHILTLSAALAAASFVGCSDESTPDDASVSPDAGADAGATSNDSGVEVDAGEADSGVVSRCSMPMVPECQDESVSDLGLRDVLSQGAITEEGATPGELTHIDATGGGLMAPQSYTYARFTDAGLVKVEITDEDAFEDMTWDIAFRRYVIRLNGGVAGPSCVQGARALPGVAFDDITSVGELNLNQEGYLTASCELVNDGSGLPNAPATVLSSFWEYPGCVKMTGNPFVIELADGRAVKLEVLSYYNPTAQQECQDTNTTTTRPSGSANIRIRWAFL